MKYVPNKTTLDFLLVQLDMAHRRAEERLADIPLAYRTLALRSGMGCRWRQHFLCWLWMRCTFTLAASGDGSPTQSTLI